MGLAAGATGWGGASTADRLDSIEQATGTKWLREEFQWSMVEPTKGTYDFSYYDHYMLQAAPRHFHILALLDGTPSWAGSSDLSIPSNPTDYANFVAAFIKRYGPHGSFWTEHPDLPTDSVISTYDLYNEPYFASGSDYNPGAYARLVKAASIAGHAADPSVKFLLQAEMTSARDANGNWQWWVDALYQAVPDLNKYFDAVSMHDYGANTNDLGAIIPGRPYPNFGHLRRIEDLRQLFVNHSASEKPFWITESGWSTCTEQSPDCVSPAKQASNLSTLFADIHGPWKKFVQAAFVYTYQDGSNPNTVQGGYGLTQLDGTPKPAQQIFRAQAATSA